MASPLPIPKKTITPAEIVEDAPRPGALGSVRNITLNPAVQFLNSLNSKNSRNTIKSKLNKFAKFCEGEEADYKSLCWYLYLQPHVIANFLAEQEWDSQRTYNCYLSVLKSVARQAWIEEQLPLETLERIRALKQRRVQRLPAGRALKEMEVQGLLHANTEEDGKAIRDNAIIKLLIGCGLRRSEVCSLKLSAFSRDYEKAKIIGKGNKERWIYLHSGILEAMKAWLKYRDEHRQESDRDAGYVFGSFRKPKLLPGKTDKGELKKQFSVLHLEKPIHPTSIGRLVASSCRDAGLEEEATAHDLRRTFATRLIDRDADIVDIQHLMGHASITTTEKYIRKDEEQFEKAAKLNKI